MKLRIIAGVTLFPLVIILVVLGGLPLRAALFIVSTVALHELYNSIFTTTTRLIYWGHVALVLYYIFLPYALQYFFPILLVWMLFNISVMVFTFPRIQPQHVFANFILPMYSGIFLSTIYLIREMSPYLVWLVFIGAWGSDIFAYFVGKFIGKRKLIPNLSPNKTVEGAIGGVIGGGILGIIYWLLLAHVPFLVTSQSNIFTFAVICGVLAFFSQIGDLSASAIKRHVGIKDFGKIIPGHGGAMDRFDSVIIAAPILYVFLLFYVV